MLKIVCLFTAVVIYIHSKNKKALLNKLLKYGIIPCIRSKFFDHLRYFKVHDICKTDWKEIIGRKPIAQLTDISSLLGSAEYGRIIPLDNIEDILIKKKRKHAED